MQAFFGDISTKFSNAVRGQLASNRISTKFKGHDLDLSYVTPRLIAMAFPAEGIAATWRNDVSVINDYLTATHGDKWRVWNLDTSIYNGSLLQDKVTHTGWPDHHAPLLQVLINILDQMTEWLNANEANIAVIHCIAGKGRTGTVCSAFLVKDQKMSAVDALSAFGAARCLDGSGVVQPSQRRYVKYLELHLRSPKAPQRIALTRIELSHAPNVDGDGCMARLSVEHEWITLVRRSAPHRAYKDNPITFDLGDEQDLRFAGDVCLRFFYVKQGMVGSSVCDMFRCQFNTEFLDREVDYSVGIPNQMLVFNLNQLDESSEKPMSLFAGTTYNSATSVRVYFTVLEQ